MREQTRKLVITSLLIALTTIGTMLAIPLAIGYINLGDAIVFLSGFILGPIYGMIAAGVGAAMADFTLGFPQYMITTLLAKGFMGFTAGKVREKSLGKRTFYCVGAGLVMVVGYYVTEVILYGNYITPLTMMPFNTLQFSVGLILASILEKTIKKTLYKK